jgi:hypothetical protein
MLECKQRAAEWPRVLAFSPDRGAQVFLLAFGIVMITSWPLR